MEIINDQRHQMIRKAIMLRPESVLEVSIDLWTRLANELISIIGEGGFQSLYSRSIHLTSAKFPWLVPSHPWQSSEARFAGLKISIEGRDCIEAGEAVIALLITFIDILSKLIGEQLTTSILRSAWGDDVLDIAAKELR